MIRRGELHLSAFDPRKNPREFCGMTCKEIESLKIFELGIDSAFVILIKVVKYNVLHAYGIQAVNDAGQP